MLIMISRVSLKLIQNLKTQKDAILGFNCFGENKNGFKFFLFAGTLTNIRDLVVAPGQKATFAAQTKTSSTSGNWTTEAGAYR